MTEQRTARRRLPRPTVLIAGAVILLVGLSVLLPAINRKDGWNHGNGGRCSSNLRQIGQAIFLYASENHDAMPPDLASLVVTEDLVSEMYVCPASDETCSGATQPADVVADLAPGKGHASYTYVTGIVRYGDLTLRDVVAFEPAGRHPKSFDGANVLLGDGRVEFVPTSEANEIALQFANGVRPVRISKR